MFVRINFSELLVQKDEVFNEVTDDSFRNAVAVMPLFARSVAAELREASDQVGKPCHQPTPCATCDQRCDLPAVPVDRLCLCAALSVVPEQCKWTNSVLGAVLLALQTGMLLSM